MSTPLLIIADCQGCAGSCCRNQPYPPFLWMGDDMPPEDVQKSLRTMILSNARAEDEPCLWLTPDGQCERYNERPKICRDFEVGGNGCRNAREFYGVNS